MADPLPDEVETSVPCPACGKGLVLHALATRIIEALKDDATLPTPSPTVTTSVASEDE